MLQWMGGSRRKVASTRKSMLNRQKQYFEQRRLQQQTDVGKTPVGKHIYGKRSENNRSLDVISLLNLSNVAKEHKSNCGLASSEPKHEAPNYQTVEPPQTIGRFQINEIKSPVLSTTKETSPSSSYQAGNASTKTTSVKSSANYTRIFESDNDKNPLKVDSNIGELDMIALLGDEDPNVSLCKSLEREAHVAFSIEGLGEVKMETPVHTPVHSPEAHCRTFLHSCSSPSKAKKPAISFDLEFDLEVDVNLRQSSMEHTLGSMDRLGLFRKPKQGLLDTEEFSLFDGSPNDFNDLLGDEQLFYSRKSKTCIWDVSSSVPHNILDDHAFGLSDDSWMNPMNPSIDYVSSMNQRKKELTFQSSHRQKNRTRESGKFEPTDSPATYLKHQKPSIHHNFRIPDMTCYSPVCDHYDVGDVLDQLMQPCYTYENTRDDMSLPSEESSSSTAVKGVSKKGTFNSKEKQNYGRVDVARSDYFCGEYNVPDWEEKRNEWKISQEEENIAGLGNFTRTSNPLRSKSAHNSNTTSQKRSEPHNGRLFEAAFGPAKASSVRDSYLQKSKIKDPSSGNSKLWIEDPGPYASTFHFGKFSKLSDDCSPFCNFKSEKHDFHQPISENRMSMSSMLNLSEDCNVGYRHLKSFHEQGCLASEQQSTTRDTDKDSDVYTTQHGQCESQRDTSDCRKSLSSNYGSSLHPVNIEDKCSDREEFTDRPAKVEGVKEMNCIEQAEETWTTAKTPEKDNQHHIYEKSKLGAQTSLSCQTGVEAKFEAEGSHPEQRKIEVEGKDGVDSRCQVMMLDSCVLQLLCIQVLKEASAKVTEKHA